MDGTRVETQVRNAVRSTFSNIDWVHIVLIKNSFSDLSVVWARLNLDIVTLVSKGTLSIRIELYLLSIIDWSFNYLSSVVFTAAMYEVLCLQRITANLSCGDHFNDLESWKTKIQTNLPFCGAYYKQTQSHIRNKKQMVWIRSWYSHLQFQRLVSDFPFSRSPQYNRTTFAGLHKCGAKRRIKYGNKRFIAVLHVLQVIKVNLNCATSFECLLCFTFSFVRL
jgi:hypothetical protein